MTAPSGTDRSASARRSAGFTLIELLVVMVIAGLLLKVALPVLTPGGGAGAVRNAALILADRLRESRDRAVGSAGVVTIIADPREGTIAAPGGAFNLPPEIGMAVSAPEALTAPDGRAMFRFFPDGSSSGGMIRLAHGEKDGFVVAIDWLTGRVSVDDAAR